VSARQWRSLIERVVRDVWPQLAEGPQWIEAQVHVESRGVADARSPVGALGLLQLMPATADEIGVRNPRDPAENLRGGVRYLRIQHEHMPEIPAEPDRLFWSFACYNAGRGYINRALKIARDDGEKFWWKWDTGSYWLMSRDCVMSTGKRPDYLQVWDYVRRIRTAKANPAGEDA
jgi:membrane-bound lytic murein transglycosylase F